MMKDSQPDQGPAHRAAAGFDAERLEKELVTLVAAMAADTYEMLVLIGECDHRHLWQTAGSLSCAAWLAQLCDIDTSTARTQVRVAAALRTYPELDDALARGDISYAKARALLSHIDKENAAELIDLARRVPAARLGQEIARWEMRNKQPEEIQDRQWGERSVTSYTRPDGMKVVITVTPPESGGGMCAAIDAQVATQNAPAGASLAQQRHDALVALITGGGASIDTEVVIHVRPDANTLADGTPLSDNAVTRLLPEAFVSLLVHDMASQPIDASPRRRTPTRRQRRVIDERHPQCAHPGCTARVFLQYDHIERYTDGGPTTVDNLRPMCGPHNRAREEHRTEGVAA